MKAQTGNATLRKTVLITVSSSALLTGILLLVLFIKNQIIPFGGNSFASMDAIIQYLDYFAYFKDVLGGQNSIDYSLTKGLGGSEFAVFSYYLASPFNLLVIFFAKEDLIVFFDLVVALKIVLASITCAIFLNYRFKCENVEMKRIAFIVLLSTSYAFSQYTIAQSSNIMWLDGVYMLPLILLGVYRAVNFRKPVVLIVFVTLSILFNWYTGAINCLFASVWFFVEYFINSEKRTVKHFFKTGFFFGFTMLAGVLLSCVLLLPTVGVLGLGPRASVSIKDVLDSHLYGYGLSFFDSYSIGATSLQSRVSIYCGCFPAILCFAIFFSKQISKRSKLVLGALLVFIVASFYWSSLYFVFSMFSPVYSYWCRFSYVGVATVVFIAAYYLHKVELKEDLKSIGIASGVFVCLLAFSHITTHAQIGKYVALTCAVAVAISAIFLALLRYGKKSKAIFSALLALIVVVSSSDVLASAIVLQKRYNLSETENSEYVEHSKKFQALISSIKEREDSNLFRISQSSFRLTAADTGLTANFNDSMAYNFHSIVSYTSSPVKTETAFLESMGYAMHGDCMNIVKDPVISSDSLLSARYVIANRSYPQLTEFENEFDGIRLYENPYAFPLAFTYNKNSSLSKEGKDAKAFDVENEIFSEISGEDFPVFKDLEVNTNSVVSGATSKTEVTVDVPLGNYAVYAYARIANQPLDTPVRLTFSDGVEYNYQCWLSPTMFYVPISSDSKATFNVSLEGLSTDIDFSSLRVCVLDLDALQKVSDIANSNEAQVNQISGSQFSISTENDEATDVLFTIPYDENWKITVNGEEAAQEQYGEGLMSISVPAGSAEVSMQYELPSFKKGIFCSFAGGVLAVVLIIMSRKKQMKRVCKHG